LFFLNNFPTLSGQFSVFVRLILWPIFRFFPANYLDFFVQFSVFSAIFVTYFFQLFPANFLFFPPNFLAFSGSFGPIFSSQFSRFFRPILWPLFRIFPAIFWIFRPILRNKISRLLSQCISDQKTWKFDLNLRSQKLDLEIRIWNETAKSHIIPKYIRRYFASKILIKNLNFYVYLFCIDTKIKFQTFLVIFFNF